MKLTIITVTGIAGCYLITVLVLSKFPDKVDSEKNLWILMGISLVLGLAIGYFLRDEVQGYVVMLGGALGYSCGTFAYQIVQNYITWDPEYLYYATLIICTMIGLFLGMFLFKAIVTLGTAMLGGYLAMRGASFILGHYLDEQTIIDLIKNKEFEQLKEIRDGWTWAYLGGWAVLTAVGCFIQLRQSKKGKNKGVNK